MLIPTITLREDNEHDGNTRYIGHIPLTDVDLSGMDSINNIDQADIISGIYDSAILRRKDKDKWASNCKAFRESPQGQKIMAILQAQAEKHKPIFTKEHTPLGKKLKRLRRLSKI